MQTPSARHTTAVALVGDDTLVITRAFAAPKALVFAAWTTPELLRRWWAPASRGVRMEGCEVDGRVGGTYRFVLLTGSGKRVAFRGEYLEFSPPDRLVTREVFEPFPDAAVLITTMFTEQDGVTTVHSTERYPSAEARAGALATPMEAGFRETLEQLAELLAVLQGVGIAERAAA